MSATTTNLVNICNKWSQSFSWLRVERQGENVALKCTTCPYNSTWARGKIAKLTLQRSDLVDHVESVKHMKGISRCAHLLIHRTVKMGSQISGEIPTYVCVRCRDSQ